MYKKSSFPFNFFRFFFFFFFGCSTVVTNPKEFAAKDKHSNKVYIIYWIGTLMRQVAMMEFMAMKSVSKTLYQKRNQKNEEKKVCIHYFVFSSLLNYKLCPNNLSKRKRTYWITWVVKLAVKLFLPTMKSLIRKRRYGMSQVQFCII